MSDKNHIGQQKVLFWIDRELLEKLDQAIIRNGYISRAEWFRTMVRKEILDYEKKECLGIKGQVNGLPEFNLKNNQLV